MKYLVRAALFALLFAGLRHPASAAAQKPISILAYHRFDPDHAAATTVVVTSVFEEQMAWLAANQYQVVPLHRLVDALRGAAPAIEGKAVAITVDDGFRTVYTQMFPIILRAHLPVTLFINPPMISHGGAYLTWGEIDEMRQSGLVDIEPHTQTHPNFNTERARLSPEAYQAFLTQQINGSRQAIATRLGTAADLLAWPYGIRDPTLEAAARNAGYVAAFALGSHAAGVGGDAFAIPRYQVYNTDRGARFAAVAAGVPRGKAAH